MLTESRESAVLAAGTEVANRRLPVNGLTNAARLAWNEVDRHRVVLATVASSFGIFGLTAVQGILLARLLEPVGRGQYATAVFYTQTFLYVGLLGALVSIARRAAQGGLPAAELRSVALRLAFYTGIGTAIAVSALAIVALPAGKRNLAPLCIGCACLLPFEQMRLALAAVDHGTAAFKRYNTTRLLAALLFPLLLIVVWLGGLMSVTVAASLTVGASLFGLLIHVAAVGGMSGFQRSSLKVRTLIAEGLPFAPGMIVGNLFARLDIFLILWLADLSVQGLYAAAVPAATLMMVSSNALELFAFNAGARLQTADERRRIRRAAGLVFVVQLVSVVGFLLVLKPLVRLVYGPSFDGAVPFAQALLLAYAICGCGVVAEGYLRGRGKTAISVWARVLGTIALLAVGSIGFYRWGPVGIPWGAAAGHSVVLLCMAWGLWSETQRVTRRAHSTSADKLSRMSMPDRIREQPLGVRAALACNFIPPYGVPSYRAIANRLEHLTLLVSTPMEENRNWKADWGELDVQVQTTWTLRRLWRHPSGFSESYSIHLPLNMVRSLNRLRPDVVISGELGIRSALAAVYCRLRRKVPLVIWATLSEHTEQNRGVWRTWLRKMILRSADCVIVNGASGERYVTAHGADPERVFAIPYIAIPGAFDGCPLTRDPAAAHRLISVGQLIQRKGLLPFLEQLVRWAADHPDRDVEFTIVGSGQQQPALEAFQLPPNLHLHFAGEQSYADLPKWYAAAGIFVFPTLADEWGLVVNEAFAAGLPVLGSLYSQAVEELCHDGQNGWTFRPDSGTEIYAAIDRALNTSIAEIEGMRVAARKAVALLRPEVAAEQFARVVEAALENRGVQPRHQLIDASRDSAAVCATPSPAGGV